MKKSYCEKILDTQYDEKKMFLERRKKNNYTEGGDKTRRKRLFTKYKKTVKEGEKERKIKIIRCVQVDERKCVVDRKDLKGRPVLKPSPFDCCLLSR